jgi:DTW domain-containing protein YfiP
LQHPLEAKHAKNTVKLLTLGMTHIEVIEGENEENFKNIANRCLTEPEKYAVCFPSEQSVSFEDGLPKALDERQKFSVESVIFIDASWRKALKMWHLNPWLQKLQCWHFNSPPENQYAIRKTSQRNSLSTLEAVAYVITTLYKVDCSDLLSLFNARQRQFPDR